MQDRLALFSIAGILPTGSFSRDLEPHIFAALGVTTGDRVKLAAFPATSPAHSKRVVSSSRYTGFLPKNIGRNKRFPGEAGDMIYHLGLPRLFAASSDYIRRVQGKFAGEDR